MSRKPQPFESSKEAPWRRELRAFGCRQRGLLERHLNDVRYVGSESDTFIHFARLTFCARDEFVNIIAFASCSSVDEAGDLLRETLTRAQQGPHLAPATKEEPNSAQFDSIGSWTLVDATPMCFLPGKVLAKACDLFKGVKVVPTSRSQKSLAHQSCTVWMA